MPTTTWEVFHTGLLLLLLSAAGADFSADKTLDSFLSCFLNETIKQVCLNSKVSSLIFV